MIEPLPSFPGMECTINTTENCNLRCKYCYEVNKVEKHIDFEKCKKFIDMLVDDYESLPDEMKKLSSQGLILDFIGGDSLVNPKLLDRIAKYFVYKLNAANHPAKNKWRFSISTNGTLFENPDVRQFCEEWAPFLSIGVSIDGCPEIHDANRVFVSGEGTMSTIMKWWDWYKKVFPIEALSTKSTCSKNTIPYLFESLKWMHEVLGLRYINQNFIMEDTGCTEEDYKELDHQLELCTNYVLEHCDDLNWSMIDKAFLLRRNPKDELEDKSRCGSGCMPCLSIDGVIYPCFRWLPVSQPNSDHTKSMICGNVSDGSWKPEVFELVREGSKRTVCTKEEKCLNCEFEPACPYCIAGCYAEYGEFRRTTHICEIAKLQCKWADKYWSEYERIKHK